MMMSGGLLPVIYNVSEEAENCFLEIGGKRLSAGNHKIKKGDKVLCGISVPTMYQGEILFFGEIVAETQDRLVSQEISYEFDLERGLLINAVKSGRIYKIEITEA